jgi:hypothetical protein
MSPPRLQGRPGNGAAQRPLLRLPDQGRVPSLPFPVPPSVHRLQPAGQRAAQAVQRANFLRTHRPAPVSMPTRAHA